MRKSNTLLVISLVTVMSIVGMTGVAVAQSTGNTVSVTETSPSTVGPDDTVDISYTIENNGEIAAGMTIEVLSLPDAASAQGFSGDLAGPGNPPSASTTAISPGEEATVNLAVNLDGVSGEQFTVETEVREPTLTNDKDTAATIIQVDQPSVNISATAAPELATQGNGIAVEYELSADDSALTLDASDTASATGITVESFDGAIVDSNIDSSTATATTENIVSGETASVTVEYNASSAQIPEGEIINRSLILSADSPTITNPEGSDTATVDIEIQSADAEPEDPTERATVITDKTSTDQITQGDVTLTVTYASNGVQKDGVKVTQSDVTTMVTFAAN